jgi:hypothetical protein
MSYNVRLNKPDEDVNILNLLDVAFKGWPHFDLQCPPIDHWRWKHIDNPFGESKVILAENSGEFVGCIHLNLNKLKVGSNVYLCTQGVDGAVLAAHREFGVFTKMRSISETVYPKGMIGLHYNVSSNPYVAKTFQKVDPQRYPIPLSLMIKIENLASYTTKMKTSDKLLVASGYQGAKVLHTLANPMKSYGRKSSKGLTIVEVDRFSGEMEEFWAEIKDGYHLIQSLENDYLNWRFCDPRGGAYQIREAVEGGAVVGFTVLRVSQYGVNPQSGYVVALYALPQRLDVAKALLDNALEYFHEREVNTVRYLINKGHPYEGMFKDNGFVVTPGEVLFTTAARDIGSDYTEFMNVAPEKILFQYGSSDWI